MTLIINTRSLEQTADALAIINPGRTSAAHIRDMINANVPEGKATYLATTGWVAHTWIDEDDGNTYVNISVDAYTVLRFLYSKGLTKLHPNQIGG